MLSLIYIRHVRVRFFKTTQKQILCFFTEQINPRSLGSWHIKETEESLLRVDSSVPLM